MPDRTQDLTNHRKVAVACKNYTDKKIDDLKWELGSHTLDVESDTTTAYTKTVPSNTIGCHINKIGGMSYKSENLLVLNDVAETTTNGITYKVENGVIYIKGEATTSANVTISILTGLNLTGSFNIFSSYNSYIFFYLNNSGTYNTFNASTASNITMTKLELEIPGYGDQNPFNQTNYITLKPMLVSGSTAPTNFKQGFEGIRDSAVTSVVSKDNNNNILDTYTIPAEVQALDGYGWGVNDTCYNYIDFETKKFIKKVGRIDLGTLEFQLYQSVFYAIISNKVNNTNNIGLCSKYPVSTTNYQGLIAAQQLNDKESALSINTQSPAFYVRDSAYTSASDLKTAMSGVFLYYELATPSSPIDITQYIDNGSIVVKPNGTITFTNTYNQAVPSEVDYLIEEVKA